MILSLSSFSLRTSLVISVALSIAACGGSTSSSPTQPEPDPAAAPVGSAPVSATTPTEPTAPAPTGSSAPTTSTPPTTPPVASACNALSIDGPIVGASMVASDAPAATGGAVADGKYHLVDVTVYTGEGGTVGALPVDIAQTLRITGGSVDVVETVNGSTQHVTETFTATGATASFARTCPDASDPSSAQYSASAGNLVFFIPNDKAQIVAFTYVP